MKYGKAIIDEIEKSLRMGMTQEDAATLAGISEETFYQWKKKKPEFSEAIKKALLICKQRNVGIIQKAAISTWQAAAWYLERRFPLEFALRQRHEVSGPNGGPIRLEDLVAGAQTEDKNK